MHRQHMSANTSTTQVRQHSYKISHFWEASNASKYATNQTMQQKIKYRGIQIWPIFADVLSGLWTTNNRLRVLEDIYRMFRKYFSFGCGVRIESVWQPVSLPVHSVYGFSRSFWLASTSETFLLSLSVWVGPKLSHFKQKDTSDFNFWNKIDILDPFHPLIVWVHLRGPISPRTELFFPLRLRLRRNPSKQHNMVNGASASIQFFYESYLHFQFQSA